MIFNVQHNFATYQPKWTGDYPRRFGPNNEGFTIEAKDAEDAKRILRNDHNLNPFYLTIKAQ